MFHEPPQNFLYTSYKINVEHSFTSTIKTGTATGFILAIGEGVSYIVTNRHVVDIDYNKPTDKYKKFKLTKFIITGRRSNDSEYSIQLNEHYDFYFHSDLENDVVLIRAHTDSDEKQTFHWHFGLNHLADESIFQTIEPFDLVCYTGFPNTHDKLGNRPILRSGHIASDPKFSYSWNTNSQGQCVAYEGFSSEGASGGPVFVPPRGMSRIPNSRHGFLIGVNAGHILNQNGYNEHSGISYFYKSTVIHEIIEQNKLINTDS